MATSMKKLVEQVPCGRDAFIDGCCQRSGMSRVCTLVEPLTSYITRSDDESRALVEILDGLLDELRACQGTRVRRGPAGAKRTAKKAAKKSAKKSAKKTVSKTAKKSGRRRSR
jgi:hypothetical protein